ncbi:MAG: ribonuclease Z [Turicibacter sp.]
MLDVILLGCGGGMPMPERYLSATLITYRGKKLLIDCGEGTQVSMKLANTGFKSIDVICITHIHGDHIIGLPGLLSTIGNSGRTESLTIIGPVGIFEAVTGLTVVAKYLPFELQVIENPQTQLLVLDDIILNTMELDHSSPCLGYQFYLPRLPKFDVNKAIANEVPKHLWEKLQKSGSVVIFEGKEYQPQLVMGEVREGIKVTLTTDTRPVFDMIEFIRESDLFICEGTYGDEEDLSKAIKNKHMTFREAATLAKLGDVKKLLLTHFSIAMSEPNLFEHCAKDVFPNTIIGTDRYALTLKFEQ